MFKKLYFVIPLILTVVFLSFVERSFRRAPWYKDVVLNIIEPPQRFFSFLSTGVVSVWYHYFDLVDVKDQNEELQRRLAMLEGDIIRKDEIEKENGRLKEILGYAEKLKGKVVLARVISNEPRAEFKSITVDKGTNDGVQVFMNVLGPRGLIGKVALTTSDTSRVILITDPNSTVDVIDQRSRARGLLVGGQGRAEIKAGSYLTRMEYLQKSSDVVEGDIVVTSGLDTVFIAGIPVGTIHEPKFSGQGIFESAIVAPFENMAELQEVGIILK